jgi:hypothetical protein
MPGYNYYQGVQTGLPDPGSYVGSNAAPIAPQRSSTPALGTSGIPGNTFSQNQSYIPQNSTGVNLLNNGVQYSLDTSPLSQGYKDPGDWYRNYGFIDPKDFTGSDFNANIKNDPFFMKNSFNNQQFNNISHNVGSQIENQTPHKGANYTEGYGWVGDNYLGNYTKFNNTTYTPDQYNGIVDSYNTIRDKYATLSDDQKESLHSSNYFPQAKGKYVGFSTLPTASSMYDVFGLLEDPRWAFLAGDNATNTLGNNWFQQNYQGPTQMTTNGGGLRAY